MGAKAICSWTPWKTCFSSEPARQITPFERYRSAAFVCDKPARLISKACSEKASLLIKACSKKASAPAKRVVKSKACSKACGKKASVLVRPRQADHSLRAVQVRRLRLQKSDI